MSYNYWEISRTYYQLFLMMTGVALIWSHPYGKKLDNNCKVVILYAHREELRIRQPFLQISRLLPYFNLWQKVRYCIQPSRIDNYLKVIF